MSGKLRRELHKHKPFTCIPQEAFLNLVRTTDHVTRQFDELLKPYHLSPTQYNVLRILRGLSHTNGHAPSATHPGVPCKTIAEHMLTRDPDITRLLDRLESRSLITRERSSADRRVVSTRITPDGLQLLKELDQPVLDFHRDQFAHIPESKLRQLIDLLEIARTTPWHGRPAHVPN